MNVGSVGFGYTWLHDFPNGPVRNPNTPGVQDRTTWNFKASGSYDAPHGIRISPVLRHQSGLNYARTLAITAPPPAPAPPPRSANRRRAMARWPMPNR